MMKQLHFIFTLMSLLLMSQLAVAQQQERFWNPELNAIAESDMSRPGFIKIKPEAEINPRTVFIERKEAFGLREADQMNILRVDSNDYGLKQFRFQQEYNGVPVEGAVSIVHQERDGNVRLINGDLVRGLNLNANPAIGAEAAVEAVLNDAPADVYMWQDTAHENELKRDLNDQNATYFPKGNLIIAQLNSDDHEDPDAYRLAWEVKIGAVKPHFERQYYVDAQTGEIAKVSSMLHKCHSASVNTAFNGNETIYTYQQLSGDYKLRDNCTATKIHVKNDFSANKAEITSSANTWTGNIQRWGATVLWTLKRTYWYFGNNHSWWSYDGSNRDIDGFIVPDNNAWFSSYTNNFSFGSEDSSNTPERSYAALDVVAHEFTHGVTFKTADLKYELESGALNESFSDIFGTVVEEAENGAGFDWQMGSDLWGGSIRDMSNPNNNNDPDTYGGTNWVNTSSCTPSSGNDWCGVHTNSGVQNFWFYLLTEGGSGTNDNGDAYSVTGIGIDDAAEIAFYALTNLHTRNSDYDDAREYSLEAAEILFGSCSDQVIAVGDAWYAVGVGTSLSTYDRQVCGTITPITNMSYTGINTLTAGGSCSNVINSSSFSVTYRATNSVTLEDGFHAQSGVTFTAKIWDCAIAHYKNQPETVENMESAEEVIQSNTIADISVYPNPFQDELKIEFDQSFNSTIRLTMIDLIGNQVLHRQLDPSDARTLTLSTADLIPGAYIVHLSDGQTDISKRVIKL